MHNDISIAGKTAHDQLRQLQGDYHSLEKGDGEVSSSGIGGTILKILTVVIWIFLSFLAATSLPPEMAFILITLISFAALAMIGGSDKIVAIFPNRVWLWPSRPYVHYTQTPVVYYDPLPPVYTTRSYSYYKPWTWGGTRSNTSGHSTYDSSNSYHRRASQPPSYASTYTSVRSPSGGNPGGHSTYGSGNQSSFTSNTQTHNVYGGGGHPQQTHITAGTQNIAPGGGHDHSNTTPQGNVIPGQRKKT